MKPLCFVLMPFGTKPDGSGRTIDFNGVYRSIIAPAIAQAGLEPLRADEEGVGGSIHKPMFERLMICDYAVADLTSNNANVFYELGIRHAFRPHSTAITFHEGSMLPFDVAPLRGCPYRLDAEAASVEALRDVLIKRQPASDDSPIFQMVTGVSRDRIDFSTADVFRERVEQSKGYQERLRQARILGERGKSEILAIRNEIGALDSVESVVVTDLFLALRAVGARAEMVALYKEMPAGMQQTRIIREQYAAQLNRLGDKDPNLRNEAERILLDIIGKGPSPETNGLLGRVYKDAFVRAKASGRMTAAQAALEQAIEAYLEGFKADCREPYPGINAVTLMEGLDVPDVRQQKLLPVVRFAAERRLEGANPTYWDHATLLEAAVLEKDRAAAAISLRKSMALARHPAQREVDMPRTTAANLRLIAEFRAAKADDVKWIHDIIGELEVLAEELSQGM